MDNISNIISDEYHCQKEKEPCKRGYFLQKRPIILRSLRAYYLVNTIVKKKKSPVKETSKRAI